MSNKNVIGVDKGCPTPRAPDLGYASRFAGAFVDQGWFRQSGVTSPHPKRLTRAIGQLVVSQSA